MTQQKKYLNNLEFQIIFPHYKVVENLTHYTEGGVSFTELPVTQKTSATSDPLPLEAIERVVETVQKLKTKLRTRLGLPYLEKVLDA